MAYRLEQPALCGFLLIRKLQSGELNSVAEFYHAVWHETHAPLQDPRVAKWRGVAFFKSRLERWQNETLVAWIGSDIAGFASWHDTELEALFIAPQHRSSGLGAKLLAAAENEMRKSDAKELSLDCVCANIAARKFYERNGWRVMKTTETPDVIHKDISTQHWVMMKP